MKYDFDTVVNRNNTDSLKWDLIGAKAPMWVADMDFKVAPSIQKVINDRTARGIFGYTMTPGSFYKSIQRWWLERHGIGFDKDMMMYATGIIPAINVIIQRFSAPAENILVQAPGYHMFYHVIENNGRNASINQLVYENGQYHIDFDDLERKLSNPKTTIMILCNPHNPTGNLWDKSTLEKIGRLCEKHNVLVISDEIHGDIVEPGFTYIPFAKVNDTCFKNSITLVSATKAFNIAGLSSACVIVPNQKICEQTKTALKRAMITDSSYFSAQASAAAFGYSEEWLDEMNAYVAENKKVASEFISESIPDLYVVPSLTTYLLWIDCSKIINDTDEFCELLLRKEGIFLSKGSDFGPGGSSFVRMNVALPRQQMLENLLALRTAMQSRTMQSFLDDRF